MTHWLRALLGQNSQWFCENVFFISWGRHWKGVYVHFLPRFTVRLFLWGADWRRKGGGLVGPSSARRPEGCGVVGLPVPEGEIVPPQGGTGAAPVATVWRYPRGDGEALAAVRRAAEEQSSRANLFVPITTHDIGMWHDTGIRYDPETLPRCEKLDGSTLRIVPTGIEAGAFCEANCVTITDGDRTAVYVPLVGEP